MTGWLVASGRGRSKLAPVDPNPALSGEQGVGCAELWAVYAVQ
jgi:hypothetical protein